MTAPSATVCPASHGYGCQPTDHPLATGTARDAIDLLGKKVTVNLFGQVLTGKLDRYFFEDDGDDGTVWAAVHFDREVVIGGVGPARRYVQVAPHLLRRATDADLFAPAARA